MKIIKNSFDEYILIGAAKKYIETDGAQPTGRILEGTRDHGYDQEYVSHGHVGEIPVIGVYLLSDDDYNADPDGEPDEDAGGWDWDRALANGRLLIDIDRLSDDAMDILRLTV